MYPFKKTITSLKKANLLGLMFICAALAISVVLLAVGIVTWSTDHLVNLEKGWLDSLVNWLVAAVTGVGGWFMLPALTVLIAGAFQEKTISLVERSHYPDKMRKEEPQFWPDVAHDVKFTLLALFLNVLILPFYLFGIGFVLSVALNSYLLGREFFEGAAGYHLGKGKAKSLIPNNKGAVYGGGLVITLLTLVPVANLIVPIFAIVWMVHVYHGLPKKMDGM